MTREEKNQAIDALVEQLTNANVVYLADTSELDAEKTSKLRRLCYNRQVQLHVVKNTLLVKAMERVEGKDFGDMASVAKGSTSMMLSEAGNVPAKLIKEFRKNADKPVLKAAYVEEAVYIGENNLEALVSLKSKNELIADVIALLQSPAKTVVSQLQSSGNTIAGIVKTLQEKEA
tara:strand:- start:737 stop:1261 length:525 start_codon:yes stop_codon:yes gene_type:complete